MNAEQIADRAMICAAIRFSDWTRPDVMPPIEEMSKIQEHQLYLYVSKKSFAVVKKRMAAAGVSFRQVSDEERAEKSKREMEWAAKLVIKHLRRQFDIPI